MNQSANKAYSYYKELYPGHVLLFHLEDKYVILNDDLSMPIIEQLFSPPRHENSVSFSDLDLGIISKIAEHCEITFVDYRNDEGKLDFPDVEKLKNDKMKDL